MACRPMDLIICCSPVDMVVLPYAGFRVREEVSQRRHHGRDVRRAVFTGGCEDHYLPVVRARKIGCPCPASFRTVTAMICMVMRRVRRGAVTAGVGLAPAR